MEQFVELFSNVANFTWQQLLMIAIGATLIYLAIKKEMEPTLLLPMGFGAILVNLPFVNTEAIETLFNAGIATEAHRLHPSGRRQHCNNRRGGRPHVHLPCQLF